MDISCLPRLTEDEVEVLDDHYSVIPAAMDDEQIARRDRADIPGFHDLENLARLAAWRWRWHLQGGSHHWAAHDLQDLRNDEDLKRHRAIQFAVWRSRRELLGMRSINRKEQEL